MTEEYTTIKMEIKLQILRDGYNFNRLEERIITPSFMRAFESDMHWKHMLKDLSNYIKCLKYQKRRSK